MAQLQSTIISSSVAKSLDIQNDTYVRFGGLFLSSGGSGLAHLGQSAYYIAGAGWAGGGPFFQITSGPQFGFYGNTTDFPAVLLATPLTSSLGSTTTLVKKGDTYSGGTVVTANTTTNSLLGIGAYAGGAATDGKVLINAGGTGKPALEFTNCAGNSNASSTTYNVFKGWLAVKIGANVGTSAAQTGTHYIRLWGS